MEIQHIFMFELYIAECKCHFRLSTILAVLSFPFGPTGDTCQIMYVRIGMKATRVIKLNKQARVLYR